MERTISIIIMCLEVYRFSYILIGWEEGREGEGEREREREREKERERDAGGGGGEGEGERKRERMREKEEKIYKREGVGLG